MNVVVEKLTLSDLDEFWKVFSQILRQDFPGYSKKVVDYFLNKMYRIQDFEYWLKFGYKTVFVAKEAKMIIGFSVIDKPYGGVCFVRWLGVLKEKRKQGIGRKLIKTALIWAKDYGCHKIELASQLEAKDFYNKCGFDLEGKRKLSYFGINQYVFGKVLGKPNDLVMTCD